MLPAWDFSFLSQLSSLDVLLQICTYLFWNTRKILLLNSYSLIPSWWANVLQKEQVFRNPHKKTVFLVHNTFFSDPGFRFGKLKTDFDPFCSNFIDQPDTARTGHVQTTFCHFFLHTDFIKFIEFFILRSCFLRQGCMRSKLDSSNFKLA